MSNIDLQHTCCGGPLLCPAFFWGFFSKFPLSFSFTIDSASYLLQFFWHHLLEFYGVSMICLSDFNGMSMGFRWDSYGIPMLYPWYFYDISMGFLWNFHDNAMIFLDYYRISKGVLWDFYGIPIGFVCGPYDFDISMWFPHDF